MIDWAKRGGAPVTLLLLLLLGVALTHSAAGTRLYLPFANDEIVDYPIVRVSVGEPLKSYRLRLVFHEAVAAACELPALVVLFNPQGTLKHRSRTFETLVPHVLGNDVIEIAGWRRWATIGFTQAHNSFIQPTSDPGDGYEGLLCFNSARNMQPWLQATLDRHGVWLDTTNTTTTSSSSISSSRTAAAMPGLLNSDPEATDLGMGAKSAIACEWVTHGGNLELLLRLCLTPDLDDALVPSAIFAQYFGNLTLYEAQHQGHPLAWPPLVFEKRNGEKISFSGAHIMPLVDGVEALDLMRLKTNPAALTGGDTLKLLPHNGDNVTIFLGGHILWASTRLHLQWGDAATASSSPSAQISAQDTEYVLTIWQAVAFLLIALSYIWWKLLRQNFDSRIDERTGIRYEYIVESNIDTVVWPIVPLVLLPLVVIWRWPAMAQRLDEAFVLYFLIVGVLAYGLAVVLVFLVDFGSAATIVRSWWRYVKRRIIKHPRRWLSYLITGEGHEVLQKQSESLLVPIYATRVPLACTLNASVDVIVAVLAWSLLAFLESHAFSLPIFFAVLSILVLSSLYQFFMLLFTTLWPLTLSYRLRGRWSRRMSPPWLHFLALLAVLFMCVHQICVLVKAAMGPLLLNVGSVYGADSVAMAVAASLVIAIFVFIASIAADATIQAHTPQLLPRSPPPPQIPVTLSAAADAPRDSDSIDGAFLEAQ